jgi:anti-sigma B factor antagonist
VDDVSAPPGEFELTSAYLGSNAHVLTVAGELDVATAPALRDELDRVSAEGATDAVVDLLAVSFVDSVALGILVDASKRTNAQGGTLRIVCDDRRIARIMEITGLDRVLRIHTTLRDALESLERPPIPTVEAV